MTVASPSSQQSFLDTRLKPVLKSMAKTPWIADTKVGSLTIGELIPNQQLLRLRNQGNGKFSVEAGNEAGVRLLASPSGKQVGQRLRTFAQQQFADHGDKLKWDAAVLTVGQRPITFSWDQNGDHRSQQLKDSQVREGVALLEVASTIAGELTDEQLMSLKHGEPLFKPEEMPDVKDWLGSTLDEYGEYTSFVQGDGVVVYGGYDAALLRTPAPKMHKQSVDADNIVALSLHETEHTVNPWHPATDDLGERHGWIEEGSADVMTDWPGRAERFADAAGLNSVRPHQPDRDHEYFKYSSALRRLLILGGVQIKPENFGAAEKLLQQSDVDNVPQVLAKEIGKKWDLSSGDTKTVAKMIDKSMAFPNKISDIERFAYGASRLPKS